MGKFGDAFDDEFSKARSAAQLEQDKRDAIKAKREAAFRPLQDPIPGDALMWTGDEESE